MNGPVRVSFVIDNLSRAGTESQLLALIRTLDRSRVEPTLVILDGEGELSRSLEPDNCPVLRLGVKKIIGNETLRAASELRRFWMQHKPDIAQFYFIDSAYFGIPIAKLVGVRQIVRVRNNLSYWLTKKHRFLNRMIRPMVNVVLTNSDAGRDVVMKLDGLTSDRVAVIENGVDMERFIVSPKRERESCIIGCVANLRPVKNIDGLMHAAKLVTDRHPNVQFRIAGDGEQREELEVLHGQLFPHHPPQPLARQGIGEFHPFQLLGSVSDIPEFLNDLDIAVLPSHSEGMSNALLEYMAAGKALVATDVGANAKLLEHGQHGLLVPARDTQAMANAITELIDRPDRRNQLATSAKKHVASHYSRDAMRQKFEAFYEQLKSPHRITCSRLAS